MEERKKIFFELFPEVFRGKEIDWKHLKHMLEAESNETKITPNMPLVDGDHLVCSENRLALVSMQENYQAQFDLLYIDPPYNTGRKFTYHDKRGGDWLGWMRERLLLAKPLLTDDAVIFVSIGDEEVHNMRFVLEEVFGKENYIGTLTWVKKKKGSHLSSTLRSITEFVLCCSINKKKTDLYGEKAYAVKAQPLAKKINSRKKLHFTKGTLRTTLMDGEYQDPQNHLLHFSNGFVVRNGIIRDEVTIEGPFVWVQSKLETELALGSTVVLSSKMGLNVHRHNQKDKYKRPLTLLSAAIGVGTYEDAHAELSRDLDEEFVFSYSKPTSLMKYLIRAATHHKPTAKILDFFAGSGSTARGVQELNLQDGGQRTFFLIQQKEPYEGERFESICDIAKLRLQKYTKNKILLWNCTEDWSHIELNPN